MLEVVGIAEASRGTLCERIEARRWLILVPCSSLVLVVEPTEPRDLVIRCRCDSNLVNRVVDRVVKDVRGRIEHAQDAIDEKRVVLRERGIAVEARRHKCQPSSRKIVVQLECIKPPSLVVVLRHVTDLLVRPGGDVGGAEPTAAAILSLRTKQQREGGRRVPEQRQARTGRRDVVDVQLPAFNIVDIATVVTPIGDRTQSEPIRHYRNVHDAAHRVAAVPVRGHGIAGVDARVEAPRIGTIRDHAHGSAERARAEQRALRTAQHLYPRDVYGLRTRPAPLRVGGGPRSDRHQRCLVEIERAQGARLDERAGRDAANDDPVTAERVLVVIQARNVLEVVDDVARTDRPEIGARQRADAERRVLERRLTARRGDDDLVERRAARPLGG